MDAAWAEGQFPEFPLFYPSALYKTGDIADRAQCCTEHVRRAFRSGELRGYQDRERGQWVARGEDCADWVRRGRPSGQ